MELYEVHAQSIWFKKITIGGGVIYNYYYFDCENRTISGKWIFVLN